MRKVVPATNMPGEDDQDGELLRDMLARAETYLTGFEWRERIEESYFGLGIGGVVAVFLFRLRPGRPDVDEWLWVVSGDVPPVYLVTDAAPNPACALAIYIDLMNDWVEAVRGGCSVEDLIPVDVPPTRDWADQLKGRLDFLTEHVISRYPDDLEARGGES